MKTTASVIGILVAILALGWLFTGNEFFLYKFFAPKRAAVERQVFEETKSYNQGMVQELQNMQFEYAKATPSQQAALRSIILHRAADFPPERMPAALASFISKLENQN